MLETKETGELTLDSLADSLMEQIGEFFGECLATENFAGFSLTVEVDDKGQPAAMTIRACESLGGIAAPRPVHTPLKLLQ